MICNGCAYTNPIALARCPRCGGDSISDAPREAVTMAGPVPRSSQAGEPTLPIEKPTEIESTAALVLRVLDEHSVSIPTATVVGAGMDVETAAPIDTGTGTHAFTHPEIIPDEKALAVVEDRDTAVPSPFKPMRIETAFSEASVVEASGVEASVVAEGSEVVETPAEPAVDVEMVSVSLSSRRPRPRARIQGMTDREKKSLVLGGGAFAAFLVGTVLAFAFSSSAAPAHAGSRTHVVAVASREQAPANRSAVRADSDSTAKRAPAKGALRVVHTLQGNAGVEMGRPISISTRKGTDVVGTLAAAGDGYVDVVTRRGRVRVTESEIVDAATN